MNDRLRRVTDLFIEGRVIYLGLDDQGKPVTIWVNKLNSFEVEEARRDGMAARGLRLIELQDEQGSEFRAAEHMVSRWSDEELATVRVSQMADDIYLDLMNDLEADDEWAEKLNLIRRLPTLLDDEQAPEDDPRRKQLEELNVEYLEEIRNRQKKAQDETLVKVSKMPRADLERDYYENWRNRASLDEYMESRRTTELFFSMRDCRATEMPGSTPGDMRWDHGPCDHSQRLLASRAGVRSLPEAIIAKVIDANESVTVPERAAGNSDAPASSSASSEQESASEAQDSQPSTPVETQPAAPTT